MNPKYKITAQILSNPSKKTLIVFRQFNQQENIIQSAEELANAQHMLDNFSKSDVALIVYIATMEGEISE